MVYEIEVVTQPSIPNNAPISEYQRIYMSEPYQHIYIPPDNNYSISQRYTDNIVNSFLCCIFYFGCICICPINIICGVWSYVLAVEDNSNHGCMRVLIKASIVTSVIFFVILLIIAIFSGSYYWYM
jgi:hypothetical protein